MRHGHGIVVGVVALLASACTAGQVDDSTNGDGGEVGVDTGAIGADSGPKSDAPSDGSHDAHDTAIDTTIDTPADTGPTVDDPCFHFWGKESWSCQPDGRTLTRTKGGVTQSTTCANGCVSLPYGFDDQCRPRAGALSDVVNGHTMTSEQASWVHYVAWCAVPKLQGTRDARLTDASRVTWWSLKEGILGVGTSPNPVGFSLCTEATGDVRIGPLDTCGAGAAWQVGASGVQVTCCGLAELEAMSKTLYPSLTSDQVLAGTATEASYLPGTATGDAIVASKDYLRASWLLHNSPIGFTFQAPIVTSECITDSKSWCYGTGWTESADYAPDKTAAMGSIADIKGILDELSP
jgi:hypothetical protein